MLSGHKKDRQQAFKEKIQKVKEEFDALERLYRERTNAGECSALIKMFEDELQQLAGQYRVLLFKGKELRFATVEERRMVHVFDVEIKLSHARVGIYIQQLSDVILAVRKIFDNDFGAKAGIVDKLEDEIPIPDLDQQLKKIRDDIMAFPSRADYPAFKELFNAELKQLEKRMDLDCKVDKSKEDQIKILSNTIAAKDKEIADLKAELALLKTKMSALQGASAVAPAMGMFSKKAL